MIELIFSACFIAASGGQVCVGHKLSFSDGTASVKQCQGLRGQIELARWLGDHPNYTKIEKWRCAVAGQTADL